MVPVEQLSHHCSLLLPIIPQNTMYIHQSANNHIIIRPVRRLSKREVDHTPSKIVVSIPGYTIILSNDVFTDCTKAGFTGTKKTLVTVTVH